MLTQIAPDEIGVLLMDIGLFLSQCKVHTDWRYDPRIKVTLANGTITIEADQIATVRVSGFNELHDVAEIFRKLLKDANDDKCHVCGGNGGWWEAEQYVTCKRCTDAGVNPHFPRTP